MCDGDGPTGGDLLSEQRHHAAGRIEDVSETHRDEARDSALATHVLTDNLRHALAGAHDVGRIDRLVRGYQNEGVATVLGSGQGHVVGAEHIVAQGFPHVGLEHGHVLVGGRVKDDVRTVGGKYTVHRRDVAHITELGPQRERRMIRPRSPFRCCTG